MPPLRPSPTRPAPLLAVPSSPTRTGSVRTAAAVQACSQQPPLHAGHGRRHRPLDPLPRPGRLHVHGLSRSPSARPRSARARSDPSPSGRTRPPDLVIVLPGLAEMPDGVTMGGDPDGAPTVRWDEATPISIDGCANGVAGGTAQRHRFGHLRGAHRALHPRRDVPGVGYVRRARTTPLADPRHRRGALRRAVPRRHYCCDPLLRRRTRRTPWSRSMAVASQVPLRCTSAWFPLASRRRRTAPSRRWPRLVPARSTSPSPRRRARPRQMLLFATRTTGFHVVSPASGPATGGTLVTVTGEGSTGSSAVGMGGQVVEVADHLRHRALGRAHPAGTGSTDVTFIGPAGLSAASPGSQFTYTGSSLLAAPAQGRDLIQRSITASSRGADPMLDLRSLSANRPMEWAPPWLPWRMPRSCVP